MAESKKVKRLSKTIKEEIIIENIEQKPGEVIHIQREKSPDNNSKCCGLFSFCSVHNNINGNNNSVNTDKTMDSRLQADVKL